MPSYKIGPKNREILRELVNKDDELTQFVAEKNHNVFERKASRGQATSRRRTDFREVVRRDAKSSSWFG